MFMKVAHQSLLRAVGLVPMYLRASETSDGEENSGSVKAGVLAANMPMQPMAKVKCVRRVLERMAGPRGPSVLVRAGLLPATNGN